VRAAGLRSAVAILIAGSGIGLAVGSAHGETAALAEREAPDSADSGVRDATPPARRAEQRRERRELQSQRREELLVHARAVLFDGIELSAEQSRGVDAIIAAELKQLKHRGRRLGELRAEFEAAQEQGDTERIRAIRRERRELRARLKGPDKCMEEMRALLSEEQRPTFDMNRARLAAEGQEPQKRRRQRRPRAGAAVEVE
jgi:hypothetical protein